MLCNSVAQPNCFANGGQIISLLILKFFQFFPDLTKTCCSERAPPFLLPSSARCTFCSVLPMRSLFIRPFKIKDVNEETREGGRQRNLRNTLVEGGSSRRIPRYMSEKDTRNLAHKSKPRHAVKGTQNEEEISDR